MMNRKIILASVVLGHIFIALVALPLLGKSDLFPFYRYHHLQPPQLHSTSTRVSIEKISLSTNKTDSFWDIPALLEGMTRLVRIDHSQRSLALGKLDDFFRRDSIVQNVELTYEVREVLSKGIKVYTYEVQAGVGTKSQWQFVGEEWSH